MPAIAPTARELLRMRRDTDGTFDTTVEIWRPTYTATSAGGQTESFARNSSGPGRIGPLNAREAETVYADKLGGRAGYVITVTHDRDVALADQLRANGRTFEVITLGGPRSHAVSRRIIAAELT